MDQWVEDTIKALLKLWEQRTGPKDEIMNQFAISFLRPVVEQRGEALRELLAAEVVEHG